MAIFNNPYPILSNSKGNFNDKEAEFNCNLLKVEFSDNKYKIEIEPEIINEPVLEDLLSQGKIKFSVLVDSKPFFRRVFCSEIGNNTILFEMDYKEISSELSFDLYPRLVTSDNLIYQNENADFPIAFNPSGRVKGPVKLIQL